MSASAGQILHFVVSPEQVGQRLDKVLANVSGIPSRSRGVDLIESGLVTLAHKPLKASYKVKAGDRIQVELPPPPETNLTPLAGDLDLLFEDEDVVVVNKPSGLVVHPAAGHTQDTLVNLLLHHVSNLSMGFNENRPGIVHRLDRDTSGILVVAKNDLAHHHLAAQFREKSVHRIYWAVACGVPSLSERTLSSYLARHPHDRKRFASDPNERGKFAVTHVKVLRTNPSRMSWLRCKLETGRTHQIRVHLSEAGLPIAGDPIYGGRKGSAMAPRLALHACELGFTHPRSHERMSFRVGWPDDLATFVTQLGFFDV